MRTLSATLLAAQRSLGGVPSLRVRIEDRELRWSALVDDDTSTRPTAGCTTGQAIVRARIGAGGTLDVQRITAPGSASAWQGWITLVGGVAETSDVALSAADGDPARLRLFFVRGSGPYQLSWLQSGDGGETWSTPEDLIALAAADRGLASANAQLVYHDPADGYLKLAIRQGWESGPWTASAWAAGGALPARHGLATGFAAGTYHLATCDEESATLRRLRTGTYTPATDTWADPVAIVPPGLPAAGFVPKCPSLVHVEGTWYLSYLETLSAVVAYAEPIVVRSADWEHWSFACWVPLEGSGPDRRAVLLYHDGVFYLALENAVWRAPAYTPGSADRHMVTGDVVAYTVEEEPSYGSAVITLHNPAGRYQGLGQAGRPGAAIRPLARVVLERGYRTAAGEERVERPPYYIISAAIRRGGLRPALRLECEDGWGLLRRWRPDALYLWSGRTIAWLIAEILCRATGLGCCFDSDPAWDTVLSAFAIAPGQWAEAAGEAWAARTEHPAAVEAIGGTGLAAVRALLAKVSASARWQADGSLYCFVPAVQPLGDVYTVGAGGEILDALYGQGLIHPTEVRVFGEGVASVAAGARALGSPRRYLATEVDPHLETSEACANRARGLVYTGQGRQSVGWVETPCQCGLDLYDLIALDDPQAPIAPATPLRVVGIVERYDAAAGVFTTRATLAGA